MVSCISISDIGKEDFAYQKHFSDLSGKLTFYRAKPDKLCSSHELLQLVKQQWKALSQWSISGTTQISKVPMFSLSLEKD